MNGLAFGVCMCLCINVSLCVNIPGNVILLLYFLGNKIYSLNMYNFRYQRFRLYSYTWWLSLCIQCVYTFEWGWVLCGYLSGGARNGAYQSGCCAQVKYRSELDSLSIQYTRFGLYETWYDMFSAVHCIESTRGQMLLQRMHAQQDASVVYVHEPGVTVCVCNMKLVSQL